jgi:Tfp pilus assembly protein PilE
MKYTAPGFTLIELLVVFSIMIILSTGSIVAYNSYNASQKLALSTKQYATVLQKAKFQTQNQIFPTLPFPTTCNKLIGYEVRVCIKTSCVTAANDERHYELNVVCSNGTFTTDSYALPKEVTIDALRTSNPGKINFQILTGGITGAGSTYFELNSDPNYEKSVGIDGQGIIQTN